MPKPVPRDYRDAEEQQLLRVAAGCEQTGLLSVTDPAYRGHVRAAGRILVSGSGDGVEAYAGLLPVRGAAYLTDLFVDPGSRDQGHGQALLEAMWGDSPVRMTTSSLDPRALSGYARFGARPLWPLLYLRLEAGRGPQAGEPTTLREAAYAAGDAGWPLARADVRTVRLEPDDGGPGATAVVHVDGDALRVLRAQTPDPAALVPLVEHLLALASGGLRMVVPGPHPGLPGLFELGARIGETDLWCATTDAADLVDPVRELPSPALA